MIKLKDLINLNEQDKPDHFGGGQNIDIFGFETKHFDICKSAVILYEKLKEHEDAKELDHLFEMEKQVVSGKEVDHNPVEHGVEIVNIVSFQLGRVAEIINDDFERDTNFIKMHVMEIINRFKRWMKSGVRNTNEVSIVITQKDLVRKHIVLDERSRRVKWV